MEQNIKAATTWLCESDVMNKDRQKPSFGGINNGYLWRDKRYEYVYNEITGYAVNSFITMYKWLGEEKYLQYSKNAADYLIRHQGKDQGSMVFGAVFHSLSFPDLKTVRNYYSFDNAVILHGMVHLYKITNEKKYLDASVDIANWLLGMQKEDGAFYSYYNAEDKTVDHQYDEFFFDDGCLHVKNAIGLMSLTHLTDGGHFSNAGLRLCNWGKRLLAHDGMFWANRRKKYVFTHAHCYATEGYLYAYHLSGKEEYLDIARKAGDALIAFQNQDGSLYRIYKKKLFMKRWFGKKYRMSFREWDDERKYPWKTIDATAQAARIWTLLYSIDHQKQYLSAAEKAIDFLTENQVVDTKDPNMHGGLYYQRQDGIEEKEPSVSGGMYTWCTQFALSAYMMVTSARNNAPFHDLITMLF
jgi:uncharacterized protein YyaL (SSP411 family)